MEDGTGYIANLVYMPGVTVDMFDWWFAWHGLGEFRLNEAPKIVGCSTL